VLPPTKAPRARKAGAAAVLAVGLIAGFEGLRTKAYEDPVGIPTVCFGETKGVRLGDKYTPDQCAVMLEKTVYETEARIDRCIGVGVPDESRAAFLSFAYNVGSGAFCKSTLVRKLNAGDLVGACNELPRWNKAAGIPLPGLTKRRAAERELCLEGAHAPNP
jgi:lysozyme